MTLSDFTKVPVCWFQLSILALVFLPNLILAQQEQDAVQRANRLVSVSDGWAKGKPSTPGSSVEVREVSRRFEQGILIVQYHVFVKGVPKDQTYTSVNWPINAAGPSDTMYGLTISDDGLVICAGREPDQCSSPKGKDDPVEFTFLPGRAEIYRQALVSADLGTKVYFAVVPDPILEKNKGCSLEAVRLTPKFETVMIRGKGYKPNEDLQFLSNSYNEAQNMKVKANADGEFVASLLPFVKDKATGKTNVELRGANCAPKVTFEWGKLHPN